MAKDLLLFLGKNIRKMLDNPNIDIPKLQEIRLRINRPLMIVYNNNEYIVDKTNDIHHVKNPYIVDSMDIRETLEYISSYSMYAYEEDIRQGFITVEGGHRIGLAGKVVVEQGEIKTIKNISFINIRLSHQIKGCANSIIDMIKKNKTIYHTLIISPPGFGKTTLLRDLVRQVSDGEHGLYPLNSVIIDERSEIAGCYQGIPQNDVGIRTDVLDCCPKDKGMLMAIRTMSPKVIAIDEIGDRKDVKAVEYSINCGCKILATIHGNSLEDILARPHIQEVVKNNLFERYVIVEAKGCYKVVDNE